MSEGLKLRHTGIRTERPVVLSHSEKQMVETLRTFGSAEVYASEWKTFDRLERAGKVTLSEPHGKDNLYKTATYREQNYDAS